MFAESFPIKNNIRFLTNKMLDRFFKKTICEVCVVSTFFLKGNTSLLGGGFTVMRSTNYSFLEKNILNKKNRIKG